MTYYEWLNSKGCGCNNGCKDINPCDCDNILLEISNLHTDDQVLQDEIDDLSGKVETISGVVDTKLDASAYTPVDLTDYYTKEEVDYIADTKLDASAYTPTDLSNYYNKQEVNYIVESAITDVESEIPSLSGYATEQWVLDKHYITGVDLSDYATEQWVDNKGYLTEHQPLKTINGNVISGTGNIVIEASGTSVTVDDHLDGTSINPVQNKVIVDALNNKLDVSAYTPTDLSNYYTKEEVNSAITEIESEIPSLSGYATEQWVEDKNYLTEHQPLKTINGQVISGTGNIVIEASGTSVTVDDHLDGTSINPVQNKVIVGALNDKLDSSAYTPVDLSNYALKTDIPTSNSAFTNDEHFITSGDSVFNNYALTANTYTKQEVNNLVSNKIWCGTQTEYNNLSPKQNDVLYLIHQ